MCCSDKPSGGAGPVTTKLGGAVKGTNLGQHGKMPEPWAPARGGRRGFGKTGFSGDCHVFLRKIILTELGVANIFARSERGVVLFPEQAVLATVRLFPSGRNQQTTVEGGATMPPREFAGPWTRGRARRSDANRRG